MSQEAVGETPGDPMPMTFRDVPAFCDNWISFLHGPLAQHLVVPAKITCPLLRGLNVAVKKIRDRPVLPDGLRRPPQVRYSNLDAVAEMLRAYRDWSKAVPPVRPPASRAPLCQAAHAWPTWPRSAATYRLPPPPPPPRLTMDLPRKTLTLDGVTYDVASDNALRWVQVLAEHPGEWISGRSTVPRGITNSRTRARTASENTSRQRSLPSSTRLRAKACASVCSHGKAVSRP